MKKTITINIAGTIFNAEEDAYTRLDEYLKGIKNYFQSYEDQAEIISDIEARIAEHFLQKPEIQRTKIISIDDVEKLITTMGKVEDFGEDEKTDGNAKHENRGQKRFFRNSDDVIIAGVASGIATYLGIDPIFIRLLFVLLVFTGGSGILIYLVLWLIMPEAKTPTEKMQMRGDPINISAIEQNVKKAFEDIKNNKSLKQSTGSLRDFLEGIGKVIRGCVKILITIADVAVKTVLSLGFGAITFVYALALWRIQNEYIDFPFAEVASGPAYYVIITAVYVFLLSIIAFFWVAASSMFKLKNMFKPAISAAIFGTMLISALIGGVTAAQVAPTYKANYDTWIESQRTEKTFETGEYSKIEVRGATRVTYKQGQTYSAVAKGDRTNIENLRIENRLGTLVIYSEYSNKICIFCRNEEVVNLEITAPVLKDIQASGVTRITSDMINSESLNIKLTGGARASFQVNAIDLTVNMQNASRAELSGSVKAMVAQLDGVARLLSKDMTVSDVRVEITDAARAEIHAINTLNIKATDMGRVIYQGKPQIQQSVEDSEQVQSDGPSF